MGRIASSQMQAAELFARIHRQGSPRMLRRAGVAPPGRSLEGLSLICLLTSLSALTRDPGSPMILHLKFSEEKFSMVCMHRGLSDSDFVHTQTVFCCQLAGL